MKLQIYGKITARQHSFSFSDAISSSIRHLSSVYVSICFLSCLLFYLSINKKLSCNFISPFISIVSVGNLPPFISCRVKKKISLKWINMYKVSHCKRQLGLVAVEYKICKLSYSCHIPDGSCCKISRDNSFSSYMQYFYRKTSTKERNIRSLYRKWLLKIQLLCLQDLDNAKLPTLPQARGHAFADGTDTREQKCRQWETRVHLGCV